MTDYTDVNDMNQYLTFMLDQEVFALNITKVREVLELREITTIPRMPTHMRGVINLRGNAVPVMDLRLKMGMSQTDSTVDTCIIITELTFAEETVQMGTMVDSVREVYEMTPDEINPPPKLGNAVKAEFIAGMGSQKDEFIIILDMDKVLSGEDAAIARQVSDNSTSQAGNDKAA